MTRQEAMRILGESRVEIDSIDQRLVDLLNQRTRIVEEIGRAKQVAGLPIYEPKREEDVYRNILAHNTGPLTPDALQRIYERLIDEMRSLQHMRLASSSIDPGRRPGKDGSGKP
jgi:chorismate mutase